MKIGVEVQIDVKKIDKAKLYHGKKGTYLTMTTFIDVDNVDQYGNNGFIAHKKDQNESDSAILGNVKVFWSDTQQQNGFGQQAQPKFQPQQQGGFQQQNQQQAPKVNPQEPTIDFDDDIPF